MKILGIIPARGGSKGVPRKNITKICGKPLIAYTIEVAKKSGAFEDLIVSSDEDEILKVARKFKCDYLKRPAELASDKSPVTKAIEHVLFYMEKTNKKKYDAIMLLQPTAPIREPFHIKEAISLLKGRKVGSVISVCEMNEIHPARMYNLKRNKLSSYIPALENTRRQDIPPVYYRNGSIYLVKRNSFLKQKTVMAKPSFGYVMDSKYLLNIDERKDIIIARCLVSEWIKGKI